jgi:hypothetical protein
MDFFTCFNQAEKPVQGHDSSVHKATPAEVRKAIYTNKSFNSLELLVVTIPSKDCESKCNNYVIKPPVAQPYTPPSHATHTSITYNIQRDVIVFFKDSWRVACNEVERVRSMQFLMQQKYPISLTAQPLVMLVMTSITSPPLAVLLMHPGW